MSNAVEIANIALTRLGSSKITSFSDNKISADIMSSLYDNARDTLLRSYPFKFAIRRVQLAKESAVPAFGFGSQYLLPAGTLRILDIPDINNWRIENNKILCDATGSLNVLYVTNAVAEGEFDPHFTRLLSLQLAMDAHSRLSDSTTRRQLLEQEFQQTLDIALRFSSIQEPSIEAFSTAWEDSRTIG